MKRATRKISIVGSGGVGAAIGFAALIKGVALDVTLHDLDFAKAEAEASDIRHGLRFIGSATVREQAPAASILILEVPLDNDERAALARSADTIAGAIKSLQPR